MKRVLAGTLATVTLAAGMLVVAPGAAQAATKCEGGTGSGRCITVSKVKKKLKVVESVPLENNSKKTVTMSCSFSRTITEAMTTSVSVSAGIKAKVFVVAEASTSIDLSRSVTQTVSQATTAAATVKLKPGQSVTCERTYGYVTAEVKVVNWAGKKSETTTYTTKIPSYMGARVVD